MPLTKNQRRLSAVRCIDSLAFLRLLHSVFFAATAAFLSTRQQSAPVNLVPSTREVRPPSQCLHFLRR